MGVALQAGVPAGGRWHYERCRPPLRAVAPASGDGLPCGLALAATGHPLKGGRGCGLAVGGRHYMGAGRGWSPLLTAFAAKT
ncbi:hypothetical protein GW17_00054975 [Ensete ventricosum]|nr:hypothetical protein GW17_00054975 [Ensete ventricosum]